jgi:hypothetical protein
MKIAITVRVTVVAFRLKNRPRITRMARMKRIFGVLLDSIREIRVIRG